MLDARRCLFFAQQFARLEPSVRQKLFTGYIKDTMRFAGLQGFGLLGFGSCHIGSAAAAQPPFPNLYR